MKDPKKREALKKYEVVMCEACDVRRQTRREADDAFKRTKNTAHMEYVKSTT